MSVTLPFSYSFNTAEWQGGSSPAPPSPFELIVNAYDSTTQITSGANYSGGAGGRGLRVQVYNGSNQNSDIIGVSFDSAQKELWVRIYIRFPLGFKYDQSSPYGFYHKFLYLYDNEGKANTVLGHNYDRLEVYAVKGGQVVYADDFCWNDLWGTGPQSSSNGQWHCLEYHVKMDTDSTDGVADLWVDGVKSTSLISSSLNFSGGDAGIRDGWGSIGINVNQAAPNNASDSYVDYDEFAIRSDHYIGTYEEENLLTTFSSSSLISIVLSQHGSQASKNITARPIVVSTSLSQVILYHNPPDSRNTDLDQKIILPPESITITLYGRWGGAILNFSGVVPLTIIQHGMRSIGIMTSGLIHMNVYISNKTIISISAGGQNLVWWSKIGTTDFTIDRMNTAGQRRVDWFGQVSHVKKLGETVVAYGVNGIAVFTPYENTFGMKNISRVGVKGKGAVCGDDNDHYFVDALGRFYHLSSEGMELLDYREFFGPMNTTYTILTYDELNQLIFICDGVYGYIYSITDKSLCNGPIDVTGAAHMMNQALVVATSTAWDLVDGFPTYYTPAMSICTDIYDFGTRKLKTIKGLEFGLGGVSALNSYTASIDYRMDRNTAFVTTSSLALNDKGKITLPCCGVEFRFRLANAAWEDFRLDYIKVDGFIHGYSHLDTLSRG